VGLATGVDVPRSRVRRAIGVATALALVSVALVLAGPRVPSPVGLRCLVAGVAYVGAAVPVLARRRPLARVGRAFAGLALVLYGADQLAYFSLTSCPRRPSSAACRCS